MKTKAAHGLCLVFLLITSAAASTDMKEGQTSQTIIPLQSGAFVTFTTETVPATAQEFSASMIEAEERPNLIRRVFVDNKTEFFFGYELLVEPVASSKQFRVSVKPLSEEFQEQLRARKAFQTRRLHPSYNSSAFANSSKPQLVGDGDTFALDVLRNPRTGVRVVDVIKVSLDDPGLQEAHASEHPARDFVLEDVQLKINSYKLLRDGELLYQTTSGCAGSLVWFSLPDKGRFIFSLVPRPGYDFQKIGMVEHNRISFALGGERYEWVSSLPVVGMGGNWNLWVLHEPDYKFDLYQPPAADVAARRPELDDKIRAAREKNHAEFRAAAGSGKSPQARAMRGRVVIGAADGMEYLLPKK
ncbi:MAG TPA: hypothetical protein VM934_12370 [Pyrinomonadaceae bacterium]|jgi:hypothetical protein|nr:hypothetical protein [Pyrinomonadaceae bacterium]